MKLRQPSIMRSNNTAEVEGISIHGEDQAARAGFRAGAAEMADMVREKVKSNDMKGLVALLAASETKSFYGQAD